VTTYAIIGIVILALIAAIVRAWNAPAILAARKEIIDARAKKADQRREDRAKILADRRAERAKRHAEREARRQR
jgi:uncharacterized membrane protein YcjF (UPF0283 family)